jgi:hypothetical protein
MYPKADPTTCCLYETQFEYKGTHKLAVKGWEIYTILTLIKRKQE